MPDQIAPPSAPRPSRRPTERSFHGDGFVDPYAWLIDAEDPETLPHLESENAWTEAATAAQAGLRSDVFDEIKRRTKETDLSVPVREGSWWYLNRTEEGKAYPIVCRIPDDGTGRGWLTDPEAEQVVFDQNLLDADGGYLEVGVLDVSPDGDRLAYAIDRDGDEKYALRFRDLRSGEEPPETVPDVSYGFAWSADSSTCWYTLLDDQSRPDRVVRHIVGTDPSTDVQVFHEPDERFHISVAPSRSNEVAVITAGSAITTEHWLLDARQPDAEPAVVAPRQQGIEYSIAHHTTGLYVTSNHDGAEDFALWRADLDGVVAAPRDEWDLVLPHRPGTRLLGTEAFAGHVVVHGRTAGSTAVWVLDPESGTTRLLDGGDEVGTISPGANPTFETSTYRFSFQSLTQPPAVVEEDIATGTRTVLKETPVLDGFASSDYASCREWATAEDGSQVPVSIVWRPDRLPADGTPAPCLLYGYGAYEVCMDPWFSIARLSLLDRGVVFAIAHVRGGGEMGRGWYEHGKFGEKHRSFSDFVAAAEHLVSTGRTAPDRLAARGGSAGGLLMGGVANLAPELFRAIVAEVPFVDPLTTMLDPSLPLTVIEREEWGDPLASEEAYGWLKGYSPYENVRSAADVAYPAVLATAGLNDPRVGFHEPAKWVARLRDEGHGERPVLFKVELGAGHGGPTGRYESWRDEAFVLAFVATELGVGGA